MKRAPWKYTARLAVLFVFLAGIQVAKAAENIEIPTEGIKVYSKSDIASPVIGTLHAGSVVPAATNHVGNFRKVMIVVGGVKKIGYINLYDIKGEIKVVTSLPAPASSPVPPPAPLPLTTNSKGVTPPPQPAAPVVQKRVIRRVNYGLHNRSAIDLVLGVEYQSQGSRIYTDGNGGQDQAGPLSGSQPVFGLGYLIPIKYTISIEPYILYKAISVTGTLTPTGPANNASSAFILNQTYVSLGALVKFYPHVSSSWWYGGGLQLDHAISGNFQIGSQNPVPSQQGDLPNLILINGAIGVDFNLSRNFFISPNLRVGALINTSPPIFDVTGNIDILRAF